MAFDDLYNRVIDLAIEIHGGLVSILLENTYKHCHANGLKDHSHRVND